MVRAGQDHRASVAARTIFGKVANLTSPTEAFFDELARRVHVASLEHERGAMRFEVADGDRVRRWTVAVDDGGVQVSEAESDVDGIVRVDRALFDRAVRGEANLVSAALRGEVNYTGSMELLIQMGQLLPGPPGQQGPVKVGNRRRAR
jgi:alkyl sulfatase BDS1-like metallo-beta-lactamase superfamily hydrolase